jgi:hypothetical protein
LFLLTALEVTFEYETWSETVLDLAVKDQMVSFKTPHFPFIINQLTPIKIVLQQKKRVLEPLRYFYIPRCNERFCFVHKLILFPSAQCSTCHANSMTNPNIISRQISNKRVKSSLYTDDADETDGVVPIRENRSELRQSRSVPVS